MGTVVIVVNAPEDRDIKTVDEILGYAMNPWFVAYTLFVIVFTFVMVWKVVPCTAVKRQLSICLFVR